MRDLLLKNIDSRRKINQRIKKPPKYRHIVGRGLTLPPLVVHLFHASKVRMRPEREDTETRGPRGLGKGGVRGVVEVVLGEHLPKPTRLEKGSLSKGSKLEVAQGTWKTMGNCSFKKDELESESRHSLSSPIPNRGASRAFCGQKLFTGKNSLISRSLQAFELVFFCVG